MKSKRILCLDIGHVRIGVAVTDPLGMFAQGIDVIPAGEEWMEKLDELVDRYSPSVLLLGYPVRTNGSVGPEAERIEELARMLEQRYPDLSVTLWDERFTTTIATRALIEGGVRREKRRSKVDKLAAVIILQDYIDHLGRKL